MATWRAELQAAWDAVESAETRRVEVVRAAIAVGLSTRVIAEVVGSSAPTISRMAPQGNRKQKTELLDQEASINGTKQAPS